MKKLNDFFTHLLLRRSYRNAKLFLTSSEGVKDIEGAKTAHYLRVFCPFFHVAALDAGASLPSKTDEETVKIYDLLLDPMKLL